MKNHRLEKMRLLMRAFHRRHPWHLDDGLYVPHTYLQPNALSWWDDVGFVQNHRRVMVWWVHPRMKYAEAIEAKAYQEAGEYPSDGENLFDPEKTKWSRQQRSRRKNALCQGEQLISDSEREYLGKLQITEDRIRSEGIDLVVRPSMRVMALPWCTGVDLCIPMEVRSAENIRTLAYLARRLLKRETTLADVCETYEYGRKKWLIEAEIRYEDQIRPS